jgi:hypothetical protein
VSSVLQPLSCTSCGAPLSVDEGDRVVTCRYCNHSHAFIPPPPNPTPSGDRFAVGEPVAVEWGGRWWPALVRSSEGPGQWRIHYVGWGESWDESVGPERIRHRDQATRPSSGAGVGLVLGASLLLVIAGAVAFLVLGNAGGDDADWGEVEQPQGDVDASYVVGERVFIEWGGTWYPGSIKAVRGDDRYEISYEGYSSSWDEEVGLERLRKSAP